MSSKVGSIHYDLNIDTKNFDKQVGNVTNKLQDVGTKMQSAGRKMTLFVTAPIVALGYKAIQSAGEFEQLNVAFETMLGNAEQSKQIIKELDDLAVKTPFSISEVQQSARQMLGYGIEAEKLVDTTRMLGDVSAGLGVQTFPQLTLAFGQIKAKGRLMGQEMLQLTNAGFNLAEAMGMSRMELMEMMQSEEGVSFEQVEQAFISATSEGGRFYKMMENQSETTLGKLSNLKDEIIRLSRSVGAILLPIVESVVMTLKDWVEMFGKLNTRTKQIILIVLGLLAVVGPLLIVIGTLTTAIVAIGATGMLIIAVVGLVIATLWFLEARFKVVSTVIAFLVEKGKLLWEFFQTSLLPTLTILAEFVLGQLAMAWESTRQAIQTIIDTLTPYKDQLMVVAKILGVIIVGAIALAVGSFLLMVTTTAVVIRTITAMIAWVVKAIKWVTELARTIWDWMYALPEAIANWGAGARTWLLDAGKNIINGLVDGIKSKFNTVKETLGNLTDKLTSWKGPASKDKILLEQSGEMVMGGFVKGLENMYGATQKSLGGLTDSLAGNVNNTTSTSIHGNINIGSQQDADNFFARLSRNQELSSKGLASMAGSVG